VRTTIRASRWNIFFPAICSAYLSATALAAAVMILAVALAMPLAVFLVPPMIIIPAVTMFFLITRDILALVPVVMHKKDAFAAGIVFAAVLFPIFGMARRYAQIDRGTDNLHPFNDYRLTVEHPWLRVVSDVNPAIETGLADADRDANVGSQCRGGNCGRGHRYCDQKTLHVASPVLMIFHLHSVLASPPS